MNQEPPLDSHSSASRSPAWITGAILIGLGIVFLLQNLGGFRLNNWWALFILIPAAASFATVWRHYQSSGRRLTAAARGPLIGGLTLLAVILIFLLDLDWGKIWPVFLILAGVGALFTALSARGEGR